MPYACLFRVHAIWRYRLFATTGQTKKDGSAACRSFNFCYYAAAPGLCTLLPSFAFCWRACFAPAGKTLPRFCLQALAMAEKKLRHLPAPGSGMLRLSGLRTPQLYGSCLFMTMPSARLALAPVTSPYRFFRVQTFLIPRCTYLRIHI